MQCQLCRHKILSQKYVACCLSACMKIAPRFFALGPDWLVLEGIETSRSDRDLPLPRSRHRARNPE